MFFRHSNAQRNIDAKSNGSCGDFPDSLVNPLYKPKTLGELKALMVHTGINPAPVGLRPALPETDGVDSMDAPPIIVTGDNFEMIRQGKKIASELSERESELSQSEQQTSPDPKPSDSPAE